jgi:hypothetical protein
MTLYPPKKVALPLIRVEKNVFKIVCKGYKKTEFCADLQNVQKFCVWQKGIFLGTFREIFAKKHFSEKKNFRNLLTQEYYTFLKAAHNFASFDLCAQFRRNFLSIRVLFDVFF